MRPIIEIQFADFSVVASIKLSTRPPPCSGARKCPVPSRFACRVRHLRSGPFHSQSMESIYAHYPGLIVLTPATVEDAYSMLLEAVAIDDPVLFCEHKLSTTISRQKNCPAKPCQLARPDRPHRPAHDAGRLQCHGSRSLGRRG